MAQATRPRVVVPVSRDEESRNVALEERAVEMDVGRRANNLSDAFTPAANENDRILIRGQYKLTVQ